MNQIEPFRATAHDAGPTPIPTQHDKSTPLVDHFSNSPIIRLVNTKEIRTVTVVWKSDLNLHRFLRLYFSVFFVVLVSIEKIYQTLVRVFHHMSKHLEVRQKYSATRRIFNSFLGVWKCDETLSLVFDILLTIRKRFSFTASSLIYIITCRACTLSYIGETGRRFGDKFCEHWRSADKKADLPVANLTLLLSWSQNR